MNWEEAAKTAVLLLGGSGGILAVYDKVMAARTAARTASLERDKRQDANDLASGQFGLTALQAAIVTLRADVDDLRTQRTQLEGKLAERDTKHEQQRAAWLASMEQLKRDHAEEIRSVHADYTLQITTMKQQHQGQINQLQAQINTLRTHQEQQ